MRARGVPRSASPARHLGARDRSERRNGGRVPRAGTRGHCRTTRSSYLLAQPDASLGGLFAAQVVEHLEPDYLMRLSRCGVSQAAARLEDRPRNHQPGLLVRVFLELHPRHHARAAAPSRHACSISLGASGFQKVDVRFSAPFPEEDKLQPLPAKPETGGGGGGLQRERAQVERTPVHLPGLRGHRRAHVGRWRDVRHKCFATG